MVEENYNYINSLTDRMEEIINEVESDTSITVALINNKNFYNDFNSTLTELNDLISGTNESSSNYRQITIF